LTSKLSSASRPGRLGSGTRRSAVAPACEASPWQADKCSGDPLAGHERPTSLAQQPGFEL